MKKLLFISTVDFTDNAVTRVITGLRNGIGKYAWDSIFAVGRHCKTGSADIVIGNTIDSYVHALGSRLFDTEGRHSEGSTKDFISGDKLGTNIGYLVDLIYDIIENNMTY